MNEETMNRLVAEKEELDCKREKLNEFLCTKEFAALNDINRKLLRRQAKAMLTYSSILEMRIAVNEPKPEPEETPEPVAAEVAASPFDEEGSDTVGGDAPAE